MILQGSFLLPSFIAFVVVFAAFNRLLHRNHPFPPGPTPLPFIGNLLQAPRRYSLDHFANWKEQYGPIFHFRIFGRHFVMLNSLRVTEDLLVKRSSLYSSRPYLPMANLIGRDKTALFLPYGSRCKETRKLMISFLGPRSEELYLPTIEEETYKFLHRLLSNPDDFFDNIKSLSSSIVLKLVYGYQVDYKNDYFIRLAEELARLTTEATDPGRWLVDSFPQLRHIPSWVPGTGFKKWARDAREKCEAFTRAPHDYVKSSMTTGEFLPSFSSLNLENLTQTNSEAEEIVMYASASLYSGGTDTAVSSTKLFFLMMTIHPDIQVRAQKEIDSIIGDERAPCLADEPKLPYVNCIVKELLRFNPVAPFSVRIAEKDDVYDGYTIPKGAWVMANARNMSRDPSIYPDPHSFKPERFDSTSGTSKPQLDPTELVFGFGRRYCPGKYFAQKSLFFAVATILWAFNISPIKGGDGQPLIPEVRFSSGHTVHPLPFDCSIRPRSRRTIQVIEGLAKKTE